MSNIDISLEQLIADILASDIYQKYDQQRNLVNQEPELKAQIDEFRRRNYELQNNPGTTLEQIEQFENEYVTFRENPLVSSFLAAELGFCRLMQDIEERMADAMNFE